MYEQIDLDFSPDQISDIREELTKAENAELRLYEIIEELKSEHQNLKSEVFRNLKSENWNPKSKILNP